MARTHNLLSLGLDFDICQKKSNMLPSMDVQSARGNAMEIREFDLKPIFLVTFGSDQSLQHRKRRVIGLELWQFGRRKLFFL